jgi:hypothetical protein
VAGDHAGLVDDAVFGGVMFAEPTVRHLTYHVFAQKANDVWKWNIERMALRAGLFNGRKILGLSVDHNTRRPEDVIDFAEECGLKFTDVVVKPNVVRLREVVTWLPMLSLLSPDTAGENEVVFSAHAKGVRYKDRGDAVTNWANVLYESSLDYWELARQRLLEFGAAGSLRGYGAFDGKDSYGWFYAGTFFWWRLKAVGNPLGRASRWTRVDQQCIGTESWIGYQMPKTESGVLFLDLLESPWNHELYRPEKWDEVFTPKWTQWKKDNECYITPGHDQFSKTIVSGGIMADKRLAGVAQVRRKNRR